MRKRPIKPDKGSTLSFSLILDEKIGKLKPSSAYLVSLAPAKGVSDELKIAGCTICTTKGASDDRISCVFPRRSAGSRLCSRPRPCLDRGARRHVLCAHNRQWIDLVDAWRRPGICRCCAGTKHSGIAPRAGQRPRPRRVPPHHAGHVANRARCHRCRHGVVGRRPVFRQARLEQTARPAAGQALRRGSGFSRQRN